MKFVKNLGKMLLVAFAIVAYQPSVFAATQNAQPAKSQNQQLAQDDQSSSSSDQGSSSDQSSGSDSSSSDTGSSSDSDSDSN